jgi:leucine dehydrogenase
MNMFGFLNSSSDGDITKVSDLKEFDDHALISFAEDKASGLQAVIAVHRANPTVPSFGATRFWHYASDIEGVKDALRLSRLMSYKAALAGLNCGGAKGVIIAEHDPNDVHDATRAQLLEAYAARVNLLGGRFVTGTDVGVKQEDLDTMRKVSRHIIGFNDNSTEFTAIGVFESVKAALVETFGSSEFTGRSFAIQGLGKVGEGLLSLIYDPVSSSGTIFISDIDPARVKVVKDKYPRVKVVSPEEIDRQEVDVFAPCALSGAVNHKNIDRLTVKIVVGGANNQLESESLGDALHTRKILYAPDYVVNAGGLIAIFDEYQNPSYDRARVAQAVQHIPDTLRKIFAESRAEDLAPSRVANRMAERIFNGYNHVS